MKKVKLKISNQLQSPQLEKIKGLVISKSKPVIDYYNRLNEREKQILFFGFIFLLIMVVYLFLSAAYDFKSSLKKDYEIIQTYKADAEYLGKVYKDINQLTPNEFSDVNPERIKGDLAAISTNAPDVQQIGDTLTIKVAQAKFTDVMNVLNQFRKSYGIFPLKLKITRLSEAGYVAFSASFKVSTQNGQ